MRPAVVTLAALLLAGCSFGEPAATVIGIDCGVETLQMGSETNQEGRRCLLEAFEAGMPAQFVSRMTSIRCEPYSA
jgi:hypothetical protein